MLVSTAVRETVEPLTDAFGPIAWTAPLLTSSEPLFVTAGWVTVGGGASLCCTRMPSCGAVSKDRALAHLEAITGRASRAARTSVPCSTTSPRACARFPDRATRTATASPSSCEKRARLGR